jgi:DNA-binding IclR family transcriptional regulator
MAHSYEELSNMTVTQLRKIAEGIEHDAVKGFSTMHKEKLLPAVCVALGVEAHAHHQVVGISKASIKQQIRQLKVQRDEILAKKGKDELKSVLRKIHD